MALCTSCWQAVLDCIVRIDLFVVLDYFSVSRLDSWIFKYSMTRCVACFMCCCEFKMFYCGLVASCSFARSSLLMSV